MTVTTAVLTVVSSHINENLGTSGRRSLLLQTWGIFDPPTWGSHCGLVVVCLPVDRHIGGSNLPHAGAL